MATSFLVQPVSKRYTKCSIKLASNKSFGKWDSVFGDEVGAAPVVDRLQHDSPTVNTRGDCSQLDDK